MLKISPPKKKNIISKRKKTIVKENGESFWITREYSIFQEGLFKIN
jgi:protein associated with RNAse G/E